MRRFVSKYKPLGDRANKDPFFQIPEQRTLRSVPNRHECKQFPLFFPCSLAQYGVITINKYWCMYRYKYVGPVVSAIEKSDLHQVWRRKRPISRSRWGPPLGALIAGRASPCSPLPTLQVPAETALASSPCGGCFFRLFCHFYPNVHSYL